MTVTFNTHIHTSFHYNCRHGDNDNVAELEVLEHESCACLETPRQRRDAPSQEEALFPATPIPKATPIATTKKAFNDSLQEYYQTCLACKEQSEICEVSLFIHVLWHYSRDATERNNSREGKRRKNFSIFSYSADKQQLCCR